MTTEELIKEILNKACPIHGKHPTVELNEVGEVNIKVCCKQFHEQIKNRILKHPHKTFDFKA